MFPGRERKNALSAATTGFVADVVSKKPGVRHRGDALALTRAGVKRLF